MSAMRPTMGWVIWSGWLECVCLMGGDGWVLVGLAPGGWTVGCVAIDGG